MDAPCAIRSEEPCDYGQIREMTIAAFSAAYGTGEMEADLIESLRLSCHYDPGLALVAVRDELVVGHVMLSPVTIRSDDGRTWPSLVLAPLGVRIGYQRQGIGSALLRSVIAAARERGHARIVLSGSPDYYGRFGFEDATPCDVRDEFGTPAPHFMLLALSQEALAGVSGTVIYPESWDGVREAQQASRERPGGEPPGIQEDR
ncbi:MAG: GNAT family N-acetyltransferase [Anaerolineae bacterium]